MKKRVTAYIDGFNMYHAIEKKLPSYFKWLDYRKLVENFLDKDEELTNIFFFTAVPRWDEEKIKRHHNYIDVLSKYLKIKIISGNYTSVRKRFISGKHIVIDPKDAIVRPKEFIYQTFEEKQTDVNLALCIFEGGILDMYDKAMIFTGDSDIAPSIQKVKKHKPKKEFLSILPFEGKGRVIAGICDNRKVITIPVLEKCLLPNTIETHGREYTNPYIKKSDL